MVSCSYNRAILYQIRVNTQNTLISQIYSRFNPNLINIDTTTDVSSTTLISILRSTTTVKPTTTRKTTTTTKKKTTKNQPPPPRPTPKCKNIWFTKVCTKSIRKGGCSQRWSRNRCKLSCKVCCGDVWNTNYCKRKKWGCKRNAGIRKNCRKTCGKCH